MVSFVKAPDAEWAKNNLISGMETFGADAIAVYDPNGVKVYSADSCNDPSLLDIRPQQIRRLFAAGPLRHFFVQTPRGILEVRGAKIVSSADSKRVGPSGGYFLASRIWDSSYLAGVASMLDGKASLMRITAGSQTTPAEKAQEVTVFRKPLYGPDGRGLQTLQITRRFGEGDLQRTASQTMIILMGSFAMMMIMVLFFGLSRFVARPLAMISSAMETHSPDALSRLEKDPSEFGQLAALIRRFFCQKAALEEETRVRARAEEDIKKSEESLATTLRSIGDAVIATDSDGRVVRMNPVAEELTGWTLPEAMGHPICEIINIINAVTGKPAPIPVDEVLSTGEVRHLANHTTLISRSGTERHIADSAAPIRDDTGTITGVVLVFSDVTEQYRIRAELQESEDKFRSLIENAMFGLAVHEVVVDEHGDPIDYVFLQANAAFESQTELRIADIVGRRITEVIPGIEAAPFIELYAKVAFTGESIVFEHYVEPLGRHYHIGAYRVGFRRFATVFVDITKRKQAEEELFEAKVEIDTMNLQLTAALAQANQLAAQAEQAKELIQEHAVELSRQATHDALTGLSNRHFFEQHLGEIIADKAGTRPRSLAVLFLDLDKFKLINDTLGHKIGDLLLIEVGDRLQQCLRSQDVLAHGW